MTLSASFSRILAAVVLAAAASGCGTDREAAATAADAIEIRQPASDLARQASGLSHMPRPRNGEALSRSLDKHYPKEFIGVRPSTSVLVDVTLDANGFVENVAVVNRPAVTTAKVVLMDERPGAGGHVLREDATVYDASFGPAAIAAIKEMRFHPARRDGRPVPYTLRMSVEFRSPAV